jgi:hypothetical protein
MDDGRWNVRLRLGGIAGRATVLMLLFGLILLMPTPPWHRSAHAGSSAASARPSLHRFGLAFTCSVGYAVLVGPQR